MGKGKRTLNINGSTNKVKVKKIVIVVAIIIFLIILFNILTNYIIFDKNKETNLVINNKNITADMEENVKIDDNGVIYLSKSDVQRFFDKYIYEVNNTIVTTYDKKIAEIGFDSNVMEVNGSRVKTNAHVIKGEDGTIYLPISEMTEVYGIEINYNEDTKIVTMDSIDREQKKCILKSSVPVKSSTGIIGKTIARVKKGDSVIKIEELKNGWTRIRTENGKIGYVKTKKLDQETVVRENMEDESQIDGKINLVWDYFSESATPPDRTGTKIDGVNVVSPSFFYLDKSEKLKENVGDAGKKYIEWAHNNGYKVWPMVSNAGEGMLDVTSSVMNDYEKRKALIESLVNICLDYDLDGLNIDFENMKQEDKDLYSRFIIELTPRIKEIGKVISVDVTAPDGGETWSLCFDRNVIGDVANYIVFMAYDQYGVSSTTPGTTAGYNWVKLSLEKFLKTEEIEPEKIILGIPFYTRLWAEKTDGTSTSTVIQMKDIERILPKGIQKQWDDDLKQNYIEAVNGNIRMKMWIEDEESLKAKLSLITQLPEIEGMPELSEKSLAGVAEWQLGMENESIWSIIKTAINE